ncbi:Panacea domain-containing protein [Halocynthiibacter styelae]|uniref:SocA family protein n=1 Tax=Halocynthiibacter styelae TaxID=2761955 RepID=A0A8J7LLZ0_9RHOB|nr:Panacea domain-containing protein [Paenihalocynthiibacter styelae]MBI1495219.1 SocA family protein [Paenihalocynthiibacter styelae]
MPYNPRKAAQTIAYFAMREGGSINVLKAVKLVYLADRESLKLRGHTIQDEPRFSLPHGPVNSTTLDYLNGAYREGREDWQAFLSDRANHGVALSNAGLDVTDLDELSHRDIEILTDLWARLGAMNHFDLVDWTHDPENVPEWQDPNGSHSRIPLGRMMEAVGLESASIRAREAASLNEAHSILASL